MKIAAALVAIIALCALVGGIALFSLNVFVAERGLTFDFYPHWVGGRAVWQGQTPYTPDITRQIQLGMFGRALPPQDDQQNFAYPAYTSIILGPVLALPAALAIAVWMSIQLSAVLVTPLVWLAILDWRPRPLALFVLLVALVFVFRYPINLYILAQFSGTVLLGLTLAVYALKTERDVWAGVALALLASVPPTLGVPLSVMVLGGCALRGRWRGALAFCVVMGVLVGISILKIGWWLPDFLAVVRAYADYAPPVWPPGYVAWLPLRWLLVGGVLAMLAWQTRQFWRGGALPDFVAAAVLACLLLLPQTGNYYLVLLIPLALLCLQRAHGQTARLLTGLAIGALVFSPWWYFNLGDKAQDVQLLLVPLHVLLLWLALLRYSRI